MSSFDTFAGFLQVPWGDYLGNLGLGLLRTLAYTVASFVGAAAFGRYLHIELAACDQFDIDNTGRVVARVLACKQRIVKH